MRHSKLWSILAPHLGHSLTIEKAPNDNVVLLCWDCEDRILLGDNHKAVGAIGRCRPKAGHKVVAKAAQLGRVGRHT